MIKLRKNALAAMLAGLLAFGAAACNGDATTDDGAEDPGATTEETPADDMGGDEGMS